MVSVVSSRSSETPGASAPVSQHHQKKNIYYSTVGISGIYVSYYSANGIDLPRPSSFTKLAWLAKLEEDAANS